MAGLGRALTDAPADTELAAMVKDTEAAVASMQLLVKLTEEYRAAGVALGEKSKALVEQLLVLAQKAPNNAAAGRDPACDKTIQMLKKIESLKASLHGQSEVLLQMPLQQFLDTEVKRALDMRPTAKKAQEALEKAEQKARKDRDASKSSAAQKERDLIALEFGNRLQGVQEQRLVGLNNWLLAYMFANVSFFRKGFEYLEELESDMRTTTRELKSTEEKKNELLRQATVDRFLNVASKVPRSGCDREGWLGIRGKRRWAVLIDGNFSFYKRWKDALPQISMDLRFCSVKPFTTSGVSSTSASIASSSALSASSSAVLPSGPASSSSALVASSSGSQAGALTSSTSGTGIAAALASSPGSGGGVGSNPSSPAFARPSFAASSSSSSSSSSSVPAASAVSGFEIISPDQHVVCETMSREEQDEWVNAIQTGIQQAIASMRRPRQLTASQQAAAASTAAAAAAAATTTTTTTSSSSHHPASISSTTSSIIDPLVQLALLSPANRVCADCNRSDPDWASVNLGVLICYECSGVHRGLGTHISKVKSLRLDRWEPQLLGVMKLLGNDVMRQLLESRINPKYPKPGPTASRDDRESFIEAKYRGRKLADKCETPPEQLAAQLWQAIMQHDKSQSLLPLLAAYLVRGGNINWVNAAEDNTTLLHYVAAMGDAVAVEFLIQNDAYLNITDRKGWAPLHYAARFNQAGCARQLLARGAMSDLRDERGKTPADLAAEEGALRVVGLLAAKKP